jgi:capsular exopolysaccharide synthesis family protein
MSYFGVDGSVGLTNVVAGQHHLDDVLVPWNRGQVTLLPAGPTPPDPGQLLGSAATASLLAELRDRFDVILIDAPPLLPVSDAAVLSRVADGVILIVRYATVRREQVRMMREALGAAGVQLIGTILTQVPAKARHDGHEYGYGYSGSPHEDLDEADMTFDEVDDTESLRSSGS